MMVLLTGEGEGYMGASPHTPVKGRRLWVSPLKPRQTFYKKFDQKFLMREGECG